MSKGLVVIGISILIGSAIVIGPLIWTDNSIGCGNESMSVEGPGPQKDCISTYFPVLELLSMMGGLGLGAGLLIMGVHRERQSHYFNFFRRPPGQMVPLHTKDICQWTFGPDQ